MAEIICDSLSSKAEPAVDDEVDRPSRTTRRQKGVSRRRRRASGDPPQNHRIKQRRVSSVSSSSSSNSNSNSNSRRVGVISYGFSSILGRRKEMEDAISVRPSFVPGDRNLHFFGVFNGHGCSHVANWCRDRMHLLVAKEKASNEEVDWRTVVERSYARIDSEVVVLGENSMPCRCKPGDSEHVGSTAVVAIISSDHIVVGNCGDSRAVLLRGGSAVPLSSDHKPDREDELKRIGGEGGKVIDWDGARVLGVLAMSRSIGDHYLKPYVTSQPEVTVTARTDEDECLVIASDGLWDVISNETACHVAKRCLVGRRSAAAAAAEVTSEGSCFDKACIAAGMLLSMLAIGKGSTDDITVAVVDLKSGRGNHHM